MRTSVATQPMRNASPFILPRVVLSVRMNPITGIGSIAMPRPSRISVPAKVSMREPPSHARSVLGRNAGRPTVGPDEEHEQHEQREVAREPEPARERVEPEGEVEVSIGEPGLREPHGDQK